MTIETDGVTTEVSRSFEATVIPLGDLASERGQILEDPALRYVTQAVASAAVTVHRLTHEGA